MKCDDLGERLVDSWDNLLAEAERLELEQHLTGCEACRDEAEQLEIFWKQLEGLDSEVVVPSERLRSRFYTFLAEEEHRRRARLGERLGTWLSNLWPAQPLGQAAWVAGALALGVVVGSGTFGAGSEIKALRAELASVSENVSLSLLTHSAASERIRGVGLAARTNGDERIIEGLLALVENDPNTNVRLAAIEALALRMGQPGVGPRLLGTLPRQQSPLLQMTLLDVLLPADPERVLEAAQPLLADETLDEVVRQRLLEVKGEAV
jgi:predicted anti-sigma-YlaC factor YlaD